MAVEATHNTVQDRVLSYLGQPQRTRANYYFERLAQAGFFTKDEDSQVEILNSVLENAREEMDSNYGGQFREFMGEVLAPPTPSTRTVSVTVELEVPAETTDYDVADSVTTLVGGTVTAVG